MAELPLLSKREREIMDIVFARNEVSISDLMEQLSEPPTRSALRSLLTILENKGHLKHTKQGREFVFRATISRQTAGRSALSRAIHTFFSGSLGKALAAHLSDPSANYSEDELRTISEFIEDRRKQALGTSRSPSSSTSPNP